MVAASTSLLTTTVARSRSILPQTATKALSMTFQQVTTDIPGEVPRISGDGNYVVYRTQCCSNQVAEYDLATGTSQLVSVAPDGVTPGDAQSFYTDAISDNGRYVAFASDADNLVAGTQPSCCGHIYWRDMVAGVTKMVDVSSSGTPSPITPGPNQPVGISSDGQVVAFTAPNAEGGIVYARNMATGQTSTVDQSIAGVSVACIAGSAPEPTDRYPRRR